MHPKTFFISLLMVGGFFFGGCATDNSSDTMVAKKIGSLPKHAESLAIKVTGGSDKSSETTSQISNPDFAAALTKSIQQSGLFAKVIPAGQPGADFQLEIAIAELQQPVIGATMTATAEATWTLTRASNGFVIWQKAISASHTAGAKEAFTGVERMRLAIEGAARDNINDGLTQLSAVALP